MNGEFSAWDLTDNGQVKRNISGPHGKIAQFDCVFRLGWLGVFGVLSFNNGSADGTLLDLKYGAKTLAGIHLPSMTNPAQGGQS